MTGGLGTSKTIEPADVLAFWRTAGPDKWFENDALFDAEIARRFSALWHAAGEGKLRHWEDTAEGACRRSTAWCSARGNGHDRDLEHGAGGPVSGDSGRRLSPAGPG